MDHQTSFSDFNQFTWELLHSALHCILKNGEQQFGWYGDSVKNILKFSLLYFLYYAIPAFTVLLGPLKINQVPENIVFVRGPVTGLTQFNHRYQTLMFSFRCSSLNNSAESMRLPCHLTANPLN